MTPSADKRMKMGLAEITGSGSDPEETLSKVCEYLCRNMSGCDWAGYYLVDPIKEGELFLGPYCGASTEHDRIAFGEGVCGQAASTLQTFLVGDVSEESNYLSCSPDVRSEIVIPVFFEDELVGEIDLDSHEFNGFSEEDKRLLEWLAVETAQLAERTRRHP